MTLLDAREYDPSRGRRIRNRIIIAAIAVIIVAWVAYHFRNYPERSEVSKFLTTIQQQDFNKAYAMWLRDPDWQKHPDKYKTYSYNDFYRDWGPGGQWGLVKNHSIDCSVSSGLPWLIPISITNLKFPSGWRCQTVMKSPKAVGASSFPFGLNSQLPVV